MHFSHGLKEMGRGGQGLGAAENSGMPVFPENIYVEILAAMLVRLFVVPCRLVASSPYRFLIRGERGSFSKIYFDNPVQN